MLQIVFRLFVILLIFLASFSGIAVDPDKKANEGNNGEGIKNQRLRQTHWVDSVYASLDLDQHIAQLLMIRVQTDQDQAYYDQKAALVARYNIGGVAFFKGGPQRQAQLTNRLQESAATPLLVAMDAEWGLSMRLDSTISFPRQMTLGAIADEGLIYQMGFEIGRQLLRMGVHMNFAPVVDVNNNPANPVINFRSFGESRYNVARKGSAYMRGMQDAGILACAKHFPGHGDTDADSHYTLPLLRQSFNEIDSIHLYPFRTLIRNGLHSVMVAHLQIPALEPRENLATTLSRNTVTDLLQKQMGFKGLVVTDALDMRGVSDHFQPGELELRALMAGNDILLLPENVPAAIEAIRTAIEEGIISERLVNDKCWKILFYKDRIGLARGGKVVPDNLVQDLNTPEAGQLNKKLARAAITLVKNNGKLIPLHEPSTASMASLAIGAGQGNAFQNMLGQYFPLPLFTIPKNHGLQESGQLIKALEPFEVVVVSIHGNSLFPTSQYGINQETINLVNTLAKSKKLVLSLFANPYSLHLFREALADLDAIVLGYQEGPQFEEAAAQVIFGGLPARGKLPVGITPNFPLETGINTANGYRVGFGDPEDAGINSEFLEKIDSIVESGIKEKAYPGCQVVLIKDGIVFYNKSFGYHTYDSTRPVQPTDIYDLASLTKIAATTASVMSLSDLGMIEMDRPLEDYLPWLRGTDKGGLILREVMAHQARLQSWIPFFRETLPENNTTGRTFYSKLISEEFPVEVARDMYIERNFRDTIFSRITTSPLRNNRNYLYSDLGFILLSEIIQTISGLPLDRFAGQSFYSPLGLSTMGFRPLERFPPERIVPSEIDTLFRKQIIHGYVNDPGAAMLGGVAGHAGLFSNALDLAVLMQVFLQNGVYAGREFFNEMTIGEFTRVQFAGSKNRRGLGFDKPSSVPDEPGPACERASMASFGHSGFTGTYAWVDPEEKLVYVFLSNRTYPDQSNRKLVELDIRTSIHQAVYEAIDGSRSPASIYKH